MRVALVNDLRMAIEALRRVVLSVPNAEIAWIAEDGEQALRQCRQDRPDVILMDMVMPVMDGVESTRQIMEQCPCPILVTTASVQGNVDKVFEALGYGAVDAVNTPVLGTEGSLQGADELIRKITCVVGLNAPPAGGRGTVEAPRRQPAASEVHLPPLVAIGASTGGPEAIRRILASLSTPLSCAIVIVQHLGELFVPGLAHWLGRETGLDVQLIEPGSGPERPAVYLAHTSDHVILDRAGKFRYVHEPAGCSHRPSVDVFLASLLSAPIASGTAVLLTGMGSDGAQSLRSLYDAGWNTIVQDEATSVVWGMPRAAVRLGAATSVLPIDEIGPAIQRSVKKRVLNRE
jgi:two-component system response regulator WspF